MNKILERIFIISIMNIFLVMLSLWVIDISVTALMNGLVLSNGFVIRQPSQMYHIGIYIIVISTMLNNILTHYYITRKNV